MKRLISIVALLTMVAACAAKLPPSTSVEAKLAIRGNQVIQGLRTANGAIKAQVCLPDAPPKPCIPPAEAVKIFSALEKVGGMSEELARVLQVVDAATASERPAALSRAAEVVRTIQSALLAITVSPANLDARNAVLQTLETVLQLIATIGL